MCNTVQLGILGRRRQKIYCGLFYVARGKGTISFFAHTWLQGSSCIGFTVIPSCSCASKHRRSVYAHKWPNDNSLFKGDNGTRLQYLTCNRFSLSIIIYLTIVYLRITTRVITTTFREVFFVVCCRWSAYNIRLHYPTTIILLFRSMVRTHRAYVMRSNVMHNRTPRNNDDNNV